jgi:hypothetical protein
MVDLTIKNQDFTSKHWDFLMINGLASQVYICETSLPSHIQLDQSLDKLVSDG